MSVRKEQDENGSAARKWAVMPLRRRRCVGAKTIQCFLSSCQQLLVAGHAIRLPTTDLWDSAMVAALLLASHVVGLIGYVLRAVRVLEGLAQRAEAIVVSIGLRQT